MAFFASGYEKAKKEGDLCGLDVFFGFEYSIHGQEFLTYGLQPALLSENPGMDRMTAGDFSAFVRKNGGYLAQAHPFRDAWWIENPGPVAPHLMDGVEVVNAGMTDAVNGKAFEFARLHGLAMQAGSDCHFAEALAANGVALQKKAESIFDIIEAIKSGRAKLV
jgi:hypothetical protein